MKTKECMINATIAAVVLNAILSYAVSMVATPEEVRPPNGAANLSLKGQFVHMMVHHKQVLLMSSLIVAVVVSLSCYLGCEIIKPYDYIKKWMK